MAKKAWFEVKAEADQPAEITINGLIGEWPNSAEQLMSEIGYIQANEIKLHINSRGGSLITALAVYNALHAHPAKKTVRIMAMAASAASVLAMAGDVIEMPENSFMMLHRSSNPIDGNAEDLRHLADVLDKFDDAMVNTYAARSGQTPEKVRELMKSTTYMTAAEAVALGFADVVIPALKVSATFDVEDLPENVQAAFAPPEEPPADEAAPTDAPEPEAMASFTSTIAAMAKAVGLDAYAADFALDATLTSSAAVADALAVACEVNDLCALAKRQEMAPALIRARASLADARAAILEARAAADEEIRTDGHPPTPGQPPAPAPTAAVKTADIWARRKQQPNHP